MRTNWLEGKFDNIRKGVLDAYHENGYQFIKYIEDTNTHISH